MGWGWNPRGEEQSIYRSIYHSIHISYNCLPFYLSISNIFECLSFCQGQLGDCWVLAAMSSLAMDDNLFDQVLPPGQNFQDDYVGIFKFRLVHSSIESFNHLKSMCLLQTLFMIIHSFISQKNVE